MKIKKSFVISVIVVALLILGGLYYSSNITGNVIGTDVNTFCEKKIGTAVYTGSSNNLSNQNRSVLCYNTNFYDCGSVLTSTNLTEAVNGQQVGDWKCSLNNKVWVSSSGCVFNFTTSATSQSFSLNNTFGYVNSTTSSLIIQSLIEKMLSGFFGASTNYRGESIPVDYKFYCLNGQEYECGWDKAISSVATKLNNDAQVGNFKCWNSSGVSRYFNANASCISYSSARGKFFFSEANSVGLREASSIQLDPTQSLDSFAYDDSYLCYNNQRYFCGVSSDTNFAQSTDNNQIVANSWKCVNGDWQIVKPTLYGGNSISNCTCGSSCGPFAFNFQTTNSSFIFNVEVIYNLINGKSVTENYQVTPSFSTLAYKDGYNFNLNCGSKEAVVSNLIFNIKNGNSFAGSAGAVSKTLSAIYSGCTNECNLTGTKICAGDLSGVKTCGQFNSDQCLEYGSINNCLGGTVCSNGECVQGGQENTCVPNSGICISGTLPLNATVKTAYNCSFSSQICFACDQGFSWNGSVCKLTNCVAGTHFYNETCISNSCSNSAPTGNNFSNGSSVVSSGAALNWTFVNLPINLSVCQWSCDAGFIRNETTNTCMAGMRQCVGGINGACYNGNDLPNMSVNMSSYASCTNPSDSCLICNPSGSLNKTSVGEFISCAPMIAPRVCNNKCSLDNSCFKDTFRLELSNGTQLFCNATAGKFVLQKTDGQSCSANYQCESNFCGPEDKCLDLSGEFRKNSGFLKELLCFVKTGFHYNDATWRTCLNEEA